MPITDGSPDQLGYGGPDADPEGGATVAPALSLDQTAAILRKTLVAGLYGKRQATWLEIATVACSLTKMRSPREVVEGKALRAVAEWECKFPLGTDLTSRDRARINEVTYEVVETDAGLAGAAEIKAYLVKL